MFNFDKELSLFLKINVKYNKGTEIKYFDI